MTNPAVANRQCIKRSGNTRRSGQTPINPVLEEPRLQLIQMTYVWSKNLTGCVKSQPGTLRRIRNWLLAKTFRSKMSLFQFYLFIGVLIILVVFGLHVACPRGCIAKWKLYSSRPLPGIQGFRYGWINRVHDWTVRWHWRRVVFPNVTLLKYKCQTVV